MHRYPFFSRNEATTQEVSVDLNAGAHCLTQIDSLQLVISFDQDDPDDHEIADVLFVPWTLGDGGKIINHKPVSIKGSAVYAAVRDAAAEQCEEAIYAAIRDEGGMSWRTPSSVAEAQHIGVGEWVQS